MLTDQERQRIYEEEKARREVQHPQSPTDQLSGCIINCVCVIGILIGLLFLTIVAVAIFYPRR